MAYDKIKEDIKNQKVIPLYYHESETVSLEILRTLYKAGFRVVEYTNRGTEAVTNFKTLQKAIQQEMHELQLGVGTILNIASAQEYINAGAAFIICPAVNAEVGKLSISQGVPWIPGCITPTEIATAKDTGAELIKLFPANLLHPSYLKSVREVFPGLDLIPTGGISSEPTKILSWLDAGAIAVGLGSGLIPKEYYVPEHYNKLYSDSKILLERISNKH